MGAIRRGRVIRNETLNYLWGVSGKYFLGERTRSCKMSGRMVVKIVMLDMQRNVQKRALSSRLCRVYV